MTPTPKDEALPTGPTGGTPTPAPAQAPDIVTASGTAYDAESATSLPAAVTLREMNERNERYWTQPGGEFFKNEG